jgi:hypothetical protein
MKLKQLLRPHATLINNPFSALLIALDLVLFTLAFREIGQLDLTLHFEYQPIFVKLFLLLNFPAVAVAGVVIIPLAVSILGRVGTTFQVITFLVASIVQWGIAGTLLDRLFSLQKQRSGWDN